jgi:hypothetical protein
VSSKSEKIEEEWRSALASRGITARSRSQLANTEARMLGDDEIRYWLLLHHAKGAQQIEAIANTSAQGQIWRDPRNLTPVVPQGSPMRVKRNVAGRDAAILVGAKGPASSLRLDVDAQYHMLEVTVTGKDDSGKAIADGYPLRLDISDAEGMRQISANARSKVVRNGKAQWRIAIRLEVEGARWTVRVEEPISNRSKSKTLQLPFS